MKLKDRKNQNIMEIQKMVALSKLYHKESHVVTLRAAHVRFNEEADREIKQLVAECGNSEEAFQVIKSAFGSDFTKKCRDRYKSYIDVHEFTEEQDMTIMKMCKQGVKYSQVAKMLGCKCAKKIQNRFYHLEAKGYDSNKFIAYNMVNQIVPTPFFGEHVVQSFNMNQNGTCNGAFNNVFPLDNMVNPDALVPFNVVPMDQSVYRGQDTTGNGLSDQIFPLDNRIDVTSAPLDTPESWGSDQPDNVFEDRFANNCTEFCSSDCEQFGQASSDEVAAFEEY